MMYLFQSLWQLYFNNFGLGIMLYLFYKRIDKILDIDEQLVVKDIVTISWISKGDGLDCLGYRSFLDIVLPANGYVF